jgi:hypothetical protein
MKMRLWKPKANTRSQMMSNDEDSVLRLLQTRIKLGLLLVLALPVLFGGCLGPIFRGDPSFVRFLSPTDGGYTYGARMELQPVGDTIKVTVKGTYEWSGTERLHLYITLVRRTTCGLIVLNPDSVLVSFEERPMLAHLGRSYPPDTVEGNSRTVVLEFDLNHPSLRDTVRALEEEVHIVAQIKISFDGFLYYKSREIKLDTVRAVYP